MAGLIQSNLPMFDGKNFKDWCIKMDAILSFQEIDEVVKIGFKEPTKNATDEEKKAFKENRKLDCKARMVLHQRISATIFQKVSNATKAKETWEILQDVYGTAGNMKEIRLQSLRRQYELLKMGEKETVEGYIGRIQVVVNAMRACDKVVKDKKIVHKILRTLTPQYDHIVIAILESIDLEKLKVEELQNSLEVHEQRLLERKAAEQETAQNINQALQAKTFKNRGTGRGRGRFHGGRGGRNGGRCSGEQNKDVENNEQSSCRGRGKPRGRGGRKNPDKRNIQCFTCNKYGHYSSECWHNDSAKKEQSNEVNLAKEKLVSDSEHIALISMATDKKNDGEWLTTRDNLMQSTTSRNKNRCAMNITQKKHVSSTEEKKHVNKEVSKNTTQKVSSAEETKHVNKEVSKNITQKEHVLLAGETNHAQEEMSWYLDSACSNHMTRNKRWLIDLDTSVKSIVRFANDSVIRAEGSCKVLITRKDGKSVYMHNVLYVPTMKSNLLSLGQLLEKGYTMNLQKRNIEVYDEKQRLIIKAPLARNRTFKINLNVVEVQCLAAEGADAEEWLWHYRFRHLNFRSLCHLRDKNLVRGIPEFTVPSKVCEG
ncbi:uncharacterized protein LOC106752938 [Vigna radiata var. radiata]|uniref:Uncharacterized protein LOC106752938 n=1 Tax=Vigna radiata var. radiata TaxID=3916 RepID=A0A1S3T8W6_VIGRR|nr:uncharacterized protein LOC106752938 [Vigna radiata var. radiata]